MHKGVSKTCTLEIITDRQQKTVSGGPDMKTSNAPNFRKPASTKKGGTI